MDLHYFFFAGVCLHKEQSPCSNGLHPGSSTSSKDNNKNTHLLFIGYIHSLYSFINCTLLFMFVR
jgi:hypothetical protein